MSNEINAIAFSKPFVRWRWLVALAAWTAVLSWVACLVACLLITFYDVESVMVTGPIICGLGIVIVVAGAHRSYRWAIALGVAHICIALLFFGLVLTLGWSPRDAETPFAVMGYAYLCLSGLLTIKVWRSRPMTWQPWECQSCGYPLYGLTEPRCPECGTSFDMAVVGEFETPDPAAEYE